MSKNVVVAAFALSLICLPAKADIINVTATGTVNGWDYTGVFGYVNNPLVTAYSATYVFDTSLGTFLQDVSGQQVYGGAGYNTQSPATNAYLTINNVSAGFDTTQYVTLDVYNSLLYAAVDNGLSSALITYAFLNLNQFPYFPDAFPDANTSISFNVSADAEQYGQFQIYNNNNQLQAYGSFHTDTVTLTNESVAAVPGPIVGAGIPGLLALFGMGGLYWRRKQLAG